MSKYLFTLVILIPVLFQSVTAHAETAESQYGNSLVFGTSFFGIVNRFDFLNQYVSLGEVVQPGEHRTTLEEFYENYYSDFHRIGNWHVRYSFLEDRQYFSLSAGMACQATIRRAFDAVSGTSLGWRSDAVYSFYGRLTCKLYQKEGFDVYCAADAGVRAGHTNGVRHLAPCFEAVPFGFYYGNKWLLNFEFGIGTSYIGSSIGVGFRF